MEHSSFVPALAWVAPFAVLLLAVAVLPLTAPAFWESNLRKLAVSIVFGLPVLALYAWQAPGTVLHTAGDYVSFVIVLGNLYVVSGGVLSRSRGIAMPGFAGFLLYSGAILTPVFVLITLLFFRA